MSLKIANDFKTVIFSGLLGSCGWKACRNDIMHITLGTAFYNYKQIFIIFLGVGSANKN
jgi:hypothetical protein